MKCYRLIKVQNNKGEVCHQHSVKFYRRQIWFTQGFSLLVGRPSGWRVSYCTLRGSRIPKCLAPTTSKQYILFLAFCFSSSCYFSSFKVLELRIIFWLPRKQKSFQEKQYLFQIALSLPIVLFTDTLQLMFRSSKV